ncbi:MAG: putative ABC transport system ATP-binding protein [Myxococcota bacterium]|jgi:putative ABC transport system ATP-binding protein
MSAICKLENASKIYGSGPTEVRALDTVSVTIQPGEFTVFSGPSGSGKSTLLNLIGLLDSATTGRVLLQGHDVSGLSARNLAALRAEQIGFIFQSFNLVPVLSALENVTLALQLAGMGGNHKAQASKVLQDVGLGEFLHRRPNQLSGGQQQRVAVARALVKKPTLVIADEPTANLDSTSGDNVLDLMRDLNERMGATFLFSTHDPRVMARAKRIVKLHDGKIQSDEQQNGGA